MLRRARRPPSISATAVVKAMTSCLDFIFDLVDTRSTSKPACSRSRRPLRRGTTPSSAKRLRGGQFDFEPLLELVLVAPDRAHLGPRVAGNQYAKNSLAVFCSAIDQARLPGRAAPAPARRPCGRSPGWLLCSLRWPRISVCTPLIQIAHRENRRCSIGKVPVRPITRCFTLQGYGPTFSMSRS